MKTSSKSPQQIKLAIDTERRFKGSSKWLLVFKVNERIQPKVILGSLETVYEQFNQLSEQFKTYVFAVLYTPHGKIHRSWGTRRKWM